MREVNQQLCRMMQRDLELMLTGFSGMPNTVWNREMIRRRCTEYAEMLREERVIADYSIGCNEGNNNPCMIGDGYTRVDIMVQPARAYELIQFNMMIGPKLDENHSN